MRTEIENKDALTFYTKLFRALELGKPKAEKELVELIFEEFGAPRVQDIPQWFAENHPPEQVMGWLMEQVGPFTRMLDEIYSWLSEIQATLGGNIDEVSFHFAELEQRVPFNLGSFPKTYVRTWADRKKIQRGFDPQAVGRLRVDTPNYWWDGVNALQNLCYAPVLSPSVFDGLPEKNKSVVIGCLQHILQVLEQNYLRKNVPEEMDNWQLRHYPILYVASEEIWQHTLELAGRPGAGGVGEAAGELSDYLDENLREGKLVHGAGFVECLEHGSQYQQDVESPQKIEAELNQADLESDHTYAFLRAYELAFPEQEVSIQTLVDVVDKIFLPFWRHRYRLFEIWSILWFRRALPVNLRPEPILTRSGERNVYEWTLRGGDAKLPVARIQIGSTELSLWYQLKTPLSAGDARKYKQKFIEPDVRLRKRTSKEEADLAILELKDRHQAGGSEEKRVARMYTTSGAGVVCIANYSLFRANLLHNKVYTERIGNSEILIVDEFRPGNTPPEIEESIRGTLRNLFVISILLDISNSISPRKVNEALDRIPDLTVTIERWFTWCDDFRQVKERVEATREFSGRGTDLKQAILAFRNLDQTRGSRAVVITDRDGAGQFNDLLIRNVFDKGLYFCIDVTQEFNPDVFQEWLTG